MEVSQVEERGFYVKIVANKGHGVAAALYRSLESLTTFDVRSSNLTVSADQNYVFTFTLHVSIYICVCINVIGQLVRKKKT